MKRPIPAPAPAGWAWGGNTAAHYLPACVSSIPWWGLSNHLMGPITHSICQRAHTKLISTHEQLWSLAKALPWEQGSGVPTGPSHTRACEAQHGDQNGALSSVLSQRLQENSNPGTVWETFISFKALFGPFKFCLQSRTGRSHYQHMTCQIRATTTRLVLIPHNSILWHTAGLIKASRFPDWLL